MAADPTSPQLVTNSRLRAFNACKRLHFYQYELCRRPLIDAEALRFGSIWHAGLESWWDWWARPDHAGIDPLGAMIEARAAIEMAFYGCQEQERLDRADLIRADAMMVGYHLRWLDDMADLEVLAVEQRFTAPLINPDTGQASRTFRRAGKIDAIARRRSTGQVWLVEHKSTTADIGAASDYWTRLRIDGQVSFYHDGGAALGLDIAGCLYDVARRPQLRPLLATPDESRKYTKGKPCKPCDGGGKVIAGAGGLGEASCSACEGTGWKDAPRLYENQRAEDETDDEFAARVSSAIAEDPNEWYQRAEVVRLDGDLREHRRDVWHTTKHLRECQIAGIHTRNPDACYLWNRQCSYYGVCTGSASIDDDSRFQTTAQHQELIDDAT